MSWKHTDWRTGKAEVRRSRRLVISMIATVGNYEYGYYWYLYQDGTIEYEVKLTGVISNGALPEGQIPAYGTLVAPQVYGPNHQHIFCVRLDMLVDGPHNTVCECDSVALPVGPENPYGNAWVVRQTPLRRESEAKRVADGRAARYWKITNPGWERDGRAGGLQAGAGGQRAALLPARHPHDAAGRVRHRAPVGHRLRSRSAVPGRGLP